MQLATTAKSIVVVPQASRCPFAIGDNESSQPEDRIYFANYYFNGLQGPSGAPFPSTSTQTINFNGARRPAASLLREFRVPNMSRTSRCWALKRLSSTPIRRSASACRSSSRSRTIARVALEDFGDVSIIFKRVLLGDATGNLLSGGLVLTTPTGPSLETYNSAFRDLLIQPFVGGRYSMERWIAQGFISVVIPTDARDVTLLFNDYSICFLAYRGDPKNLISFIMPTFEAQLTTPLDHLNGTNPITAPELFAVTAGAHFGIRNRTTLTLALSTPVTGPRLYNLEATAFLNYNF